MISGLYPLIGWKIKDEVVFVLEATARSGGNILEWGRDVGIITDITETANIAQSVSDTNNLFFVPCMHSFDFKCSDLC
jgi:putative glycerol kinase 5